ncbi:alginate lyase-domain-containing protein [Sporodiniella umbellata]|nr:alginate lyase-domain-containing protein [Sporodiniella umbellata]
MGPKKPELEYITLPSDENSTSCTMNDNEALGCLLKLSNESLKSGPFSITFGKATPHIAPTGNVKDFLSYAPYWWPENPSDPHTKYVRRDGKRNPDAAVVKDQYQLESLAENLLYLCLGYHFFKNERYASHATLLLDTFFVNEVTGMNSHLTYAQIVRGSQNTKVMGRGEGIISARALCRVVNVLPLLDNFCGYQTIRAQIVHWFFCYSKWLQQSPVAKMALKAKNNIHTWYIAHLVSVERFLDPSSMSLVACIKDFFGHSLPAQIDSSTGNQPLEAKRARPFHYLVFNMQAILYIAEVARSIGLNMYCFKQDLLHSAIKYICEFKTLEVDVTEAARCVEIASKRVCTQDCCKNFVEYCHHSKYYEKISGPKNTICSLWL